MGFDLTRFVGKVDEEFRCSICWMIFDDPVETQCGHAFCKECIIRWLSANVTCPIDRTPLLQCDLKAPGRLFSNLLAKLKINCNFEVEGCNVVVELGHLQHHLMICKFNPDSETTCDKGCDGKIHRRERPTHNCLTHLLHENQKIQLTAVHQEDVNILLKHMLERQNRERSRLQEKIENLMSRQDIQSRELLNCELTTIRQEEEITKLKEEVEKQHLKLNNEMQRRKEEMTQHSDKVIPKWNKGNSLRFSEESNDFECMSHWGEAQANYFLNPQNSFCVEILNISHDGLIVIGLAPKDRSLSDKDNTQYANTGSITNFGKIHFGKAQSGVGDIIECGIKYPQNVNETQVTNLMVYFSINGKPVPNLYRMLPSRFFPTIQLYGIGTKVKVHYNTMQP